MGRASREKGKRGEREAAKALNELLGTECRRGQQFSGVEGRDVVGLPGVHIECKRTEKLSLYKAVEQAKRDAGDEVPLLLHRRNDSEWLAVVPLTSLLRLARSVTVAARADIQEEGNGLPVAREGHGA